MSGRPAAVVGGGIGGLAAAIALRRAGWLVTVFERAPEPRPLGAGLSVWPNGVRALRALGLDAVVDAPGVPRVSGALRTAAGSVLGEFDPAAIEGRFGQPLIGLHRADLQRALLAALGEATLELGAEVVGTDAQGVRLAGGAEREAQLIVGADGIRSTVRAGLIGDGEPLDSGIVAARGVVSSQAAVPAGEWWGPGTVAGLLPLSRGRVYWYMAGRGDLDAADVERRARAFGEPLPRLIAETDPAAVLRHELLDRDPLEQWRRGAATLLGDAAHPMLPFLGQGACAALEDAVALGASLSDGVEVGEGLAAYERARIAPTTILVRRSRTAAKAALAPAPLRALRNLLVRLAPEGARLRQLDPILGRA